MTSYETQSDREKLFWFGYENCKAKPPKLSMEAQFIQFSKYQKPVQYGRILEEA